MAEIQLGGQVRSLKFSHIAIKTLETHYGMGLQEIFEKVNLQSIENMGVLLWVCLKRHERSVTLDEVEEWLDDALDSQMLTYEQIASLVKETFEESSMAQQGVASTAAGAGSGGKKRKGA